MTRPTSRILLLGTALSLSATAVSGPAAAAEAPALGTTWPASAVERPADPATVLALARACIDPRHASLVANAVLRHGRTFTLAEAQSWCSR